MILAAKTVVLSVAMASSASTLMAEGCAVPCWTPPTCAAPSCAAPGGCESCSTCGTCSTCQNCQPVKNIDRSKRITKVKRNVFLGALGGEAPPQGTIVGSAPIINVPAMVTLPVSFGGASINTNPSVGGAAINNKPKVGAAGLGDDDSTCNDPCGDIKQLKQDVLELQEAILNLNSKQDKNQKELLQKIAEIK